MHLQVIINEKKKKTSCGCSKNFIFIKAHQCFIQSRKTNESWYEFKWCFNIIGNCFMVLLKGLKSGLLNMRSQDCLELELPISDLEVP